ncbi:MAG: orotate phosphoribosyltransferase [Thermoguttaceae bacterium]|nr:orotate phosphoribosyltransferase [Thermoguttaceae bacterium]
MYSKDKLAAIVRERSLKIAPEGEFFTLASGKKSKYYCDGKMTTLDAAGAVLIGEGILELIQQDANFPNAVGGMSMGADTICAAVITVAGSRGIDLKAFLVRKETKDHGTQKYIEGPVKAGDRVIVVEDVVTTGGSSLKAIERLEEAGIKVDGVIAILDRMEGGAKAFTDRGYSFRSLLKITDFGIDPPQA